MDAKNESEQKQQLVRFFDANQLQNNLTSIFKKLKDLQQSDGSFSWWPEMKGSLYMTVAVTKITRSSAEYYDSYARANGHD